MQPAVLPLTKRIRFAVSQFIRWLHPYGPTRLQSVGESVDGGLEVTILCNERNQDGPFLLVFSAKEYRRVRIPRAEGVDLPAGGEGI